VSGGTVSDKTASIAQRYKLVAWLDNKQLLESETEYFCERRELDFLYFAIEQLPDKHRQVIKSLYIEGLSWRETADNMGVCTSTIKKCVDNSIKLISEMMQKGC
jgi:DNA-directed RNA polymerase specialized sigma subunit